MERSAKTIVIGAGVIGLATTHALLRREEDVLCLEASDAPGGIQSRGPGRIMRNLHRDHDLIDLARVAAGEWRALERELDAELLGAEGQLIASPRAEQYAELLREHSINCEVLEPGDELPGGFGLAEIPVPLLFDRDAGAIRAERVMAELAAAAHPAIRLGKAVVEIRRREGGFELEDVAGNTWRCERLLIAAGAASGSLAAQLGLEVPQVNEWHLRLAFSGAGERWPCWRDETEEFGAAAYGLRLGGGHYALALAGISNPEHHDELAELGKMIVNYAQRAFPGLAPGAGRVVAQVSRLDGESSDAFELFEADGALCLAGGNLFKFVPVIARQLADELSA
jgi:sarcosine oxidase